MAKFYRDYQTYHKFTNTMIGVLPKILDIDIKSKNIVINISENEDKDVFGEYYTQFDDEDSILIFKEYINIYLKQILDNVHPKDVMYQIVCTLSHELYHSVNNNTFSDYLLDVSTKDRNIAVSLIEYETHIKTLTTLLLKIDEFSDYISNLDEFHSFLHAKRASNLSNYVAFLTKENSFLLKYYNEIGGFRVLQNIKHLKNVYNEMERVIKNFEFPKVSRKVEK